MSELNKIQAEIVGYEIALNQLRKRESQLAQKVPEDVANINVEVIRLYAKQYRDEIARIGNDAVCDESDWSHYALEAIVEAVFPEGFYTWARKQEGTEAY